MNALPELSYKISILREMGLRYGMVIQRREKRKLFRKVPSVQVSLRLTANKGPAMPILHLWTKHSELRTYLAKSPWAPAHAVERFANLTGLADLAIEAYMVPDLVRTEQEKLRAVADDQAKVLTEGLSSLLEELLIEATREVGSDAYGELQRAFADSQLAIESGEQAYGEVSQAYRAHMDRA